MKIRTELLNLITGALLVASGVLNFIDGDFEIGMSWLIFGAMYLIMNDYIQNPGTKTLFEKTTDVTRIMFSWVGLLGSAILLVYYVLIIF